MQEIESHTLILATEEKVWEILTDFSAYVEWNPFIRNISGSFKEGEKLNLELQFHSSQKLTQTTLRILQIHQKERLKWEEVIFSSKLLKRVHTVEILPHPSGVNILQKERISGFLVRWKSNETKKRLEGFK